MAFLFCLDCFQILSDVFSMGFSHQAIAIVYFLRLELAMVKKNSCPKTTFLLDTSYSFNEHFCHKSILNDTVFIVISLKVTTRLSIYVTVFCSRVLHDTVLNVSFICLLSQINATQTANQKLLASPLPKHRNGKERRCF